MPESVVITRPAAQAAELATRMQQIGVTPLIFPLLEIHPLADQRALQAALMRLDDYALVAFVSPNAIDCAFAVRPLWPQAVALAVMGEGSRASLARHGVCAPAYQITSPTDPHRTDSETLLAALAPVQLRGKRVLILRGESGRELLGDALRAAGALVDQVAAYRRSAPVLTTAVGNQLAELLDTPHAWVLTSSEALRNLLDMVGKTAGANGVAKIRQKTLLVPHARIAQTARELGFTQVTQTDPGDVGLLQAMQNLHASQPLQAAQALQSRP
ncbi:MAG: uroporphyrinogen-III synthase [Pseudomonadota bacterium]|nr:uroporphyrinogen-III synthase [Pseudomonadota bacterium]